MRYISDEEYAVIKPQARKLHGMIRAIRMDEFPDAIRKNHPEIVKEEAVLNQLLHDTLGTTKDYDIITFFSETLPLRQDLTELINS